jgi:hypothetical protein
MIVNNAEMYNMSEFFSHKSKIYYSIPDKQMTAMSNL